MVLYLLSMEGGAGLNVSDGQNSGTVPGCQKLACTEKVVT